MTDQPPRWQCAVFIIGVFIVMIVMAPGMAAGALIRSRAFMWSAWSVSILVGAYAAFIK